MFRQTLTAIAFVAVLSSISANPLETSAEETKTVSDSFGYVQLGLGPAPLPLPVFGLGYRGQSNHHGIDASLQVSTIVFITQVKANALYLYYFTPDLKAQFYAGTGVGVSGFFYDTFDKDKKRGLISPEFVFGKQYLNNVGSTRYFQAQMSFPTFKFSHFSKPFYFPLVVFSYGIGF